MKQRFLLLCVIVFLVSFLVPAIGHSKPAPLKNGWVTIIIEPVFNGEPLVLRDQNYVDEHGDTLSIDLFRFYITHARFKFDSFVSEDTTSHLVDFENEATTRFNVYNVTAGIYSSVQFMAGVDSIANTSGANGGDLDPEKGMYWAWNTGYIMAKLEGHSKVCKTLHHVFEFHIGGYKLTYNTARTVNVKLPKPVYVLNGCNTIIKIKADAAAWFKGNLDLSKLNNVVKPGKDAGIIADNYAQMFSAE